MDILIIDYKLRTCIKKLANLPAKYRNIIFNKLCNMHYLTLIFKLFYVVLVQKNTKAYNTQMETPKITYYTVYLFEQNRSNDS